MCLGLVLFLNPPRPHQALPALESLHSDIKFGLLAAAALAAALPASRLAALCLSSPSTVTVREVASALPSARSLSVLHLDLTLALADGGDAAPPLLALAAALPRSALTQLCLTRQSTYAQPGTQPVPLPTPVYQALAELAAALPRSEVTRMELKCLLDGGGVVADALARALPQTKLTELTLDGDHTGRAAEVLAAAVPHTRLHSLNLRTMVDAAAGVHALARALPSAVLLRNLDLRDSWGLHGGPLAALAAALPHTQLEDLDLSYCDLDAKDFSAVTNALKAGTRLRKVRVLSCAYEENSDRYSAEKAVHDRAVEALHAAAGSSWPDDD